ncbi:uncharacterized protein LOC120086244 [Benincasa hispida]|uniref:uncharacterized protein LOC120086244 n=1 Tax=Benincasa hispida TaxID=102211 RepID=UPI001900BDD5|nr:uncharacterized protein LOC120086244 [Benincasa hispida]
MESSLSEAQRGVAVSSNDPSVHQYLVPNRQMELMESISGGSLTQSGMLSRMQRGQVDLKAGNFGRQQLQIPDNQFGGTGNMVRTSEGVLSLPVKRKASTEPFNSPSQQSPLHNKRLAPVEHRPWLQQASGIAKRPHLQIPNNALAPVAVHSPAGTKRKVQQMESHPTKVGHQRSNASKGQTALPIPTSKIQNEPTGSVRSKMRESLTAALALVSQEQEKSSNDEKSPPAEAEKSATPKQENPLSSGPAIGHVSDDSKKIFSEKLDSVVLEDNVGKMLDKHSLCVNVSDLETLRYDDGRVFQPNNVLSYEDISFGDNFFIKDDLLQENGLSWVLEADLGVADKKETQTDELQKMDVGVENQNEGAKPVQTPESLAFKIEEELFKLFSGVNKKYKEKGRSLLFNLKDRNNPELRERVMSGEITPERLCSMTAEELASKELSEWRMAKAEEFAQMVVLPDSEVDIRRLVKKTHKGEFQVEVEEYDNASTDVSSGASTFSQSQRTKNETENGSPNEPETIKDEQNISGQKNGASDKDNYTFTIASNEGDLMQGLMVDDGLKDTELLPPIVSLDEFMESLDTEPPFDILAEDAGKLSPILEKGESEPSSRLKAAAHTTKGATDVRTDKNNEESHTKADIDSSSTGQVDLKPSPSKADVDSNDNQAGLRTSDRNDAAKSSDNNAKSGTESLASTFKLEHLWDGILQYNISTMTSVVGTYISGERTSAKDWPGILEIKGRVRLDAFEKFLQELPLSRSRAVMVLHLDVKEGRPESERADLREVAESYVMDERVGIAEPGSGVEFYFCPPHRRILEMLGRILLKETNEALNAIENGLIGVVVWRKTQLTSMSPNSTSHHKRSSKKQHFSSRRPQETSNLKPNNISPKETMPHGYFPIVATHPPPEEDDDADGDDDIPPGFGPSSARDDDDLPEFNFSGSANPPGFSSQNNHPPTPRGQSSRPPTFQPVSQTGSRPVEQMRELVHKYGQNLSKNISTANWGERGFSSVSIQPWNDDDDDIPEWQPQAATSQHQMPPPSHSQQQLPVRGFQQPSIRAHYMVNQQQPIGHPPPLNVSQQGTWWAPQQGHNINNNLQPTSNFSSSHHGNNGQFYGAFGRSASSNPSNNRGF